MATRSTTTAQPTNMPSKTALRKAARGATTTEGSKPRTHHGGPDTSRLGIDAKLLLTPKATGELLSISESQVRRLIQRGGLPKFRVGRLILVPRAKLDLWIEQQLAAQSA